MDSILVVSATSYEIAPFINHLDKEGKKINFSTYEIGSQQYQILITGVGPILTVHALCKFFNYNKPTKAIHAGIAGSWNDLNLGQVVQVVQDRFGDVGVQKSDGSFSDVYELELADPGFHPFQDGWLNAGEKELFSVQSMPKVKGVTVSKVTGTTEAAEKIKAKYNPDIETMESASFFYACLMDHVDFISLRSISNYVGLRNRETWDVPLAIERLNEALIDLIEVT